MQMSRLLEILMKVISVITPHHLVFFWVTMPGGILKYMGIMKGTHLKLNKCQLAKNKIFLQMILVSE